MNISKLPLVSVVISAYNHENYIQETINSIIAQTYEKIELIIIDDGSIDLTFEKILEMENVCKERFINIIFKKQKNQGIGTTANNLINLSQGKYIYYIASDDLAKPTAIYEEVSFLEKHDDYSLVVGDNEIIDKNGIICYWDKSRNLIYEESAATHKTYGDFLRIKELGNNFGRYLYLYKGNHIPNGYLVRKEIYEKTGINNEKAPLDDWFMNLQIAKYAKIKYLDKVLFSYRWHHTNTSKQGQKMQLLYDLTIQYENDLLSKTDFKLVHKDALYCFLFGKIIKKVSIINNKIEFHKYRKNNIKMWVLHILGCDFIIRKKFLSND